MELDTAARRMLLQNDTVRGYVQEKVFKNDLLEHVEGTSGMAIVVRKGGGWSSPDLVQSSEFPVLVVECWADVDRVEGEKVRDNATDKAYALYRAVDPLLHRIRDVVWGAGGSDPGVRVITSMRSGEPRHIQRGYSRAGENIPMQESTLVEIAYNVHL